MTLPQLPGCEGRDGGHTSTFPRQARSGVSWSTDSSGNSPNHEACPYARIREGEAMNYVAQVSGRGTGVYHVAHGAADSPPVFIEGDRVFGGKGRAAGPFEHLLSALGACCQITAQIVAQSRGWTVRGFRSTTVAQFDNAVLVRGLPGTSRFRSVDIEIAVESDLTPQQIHDLGIEVERRCPVYQLFLAAGTPVTSSWSSTGQ
ncbi:OsmC family protein [Nocardia sp. CA2R105]|uniref:OsmC family protein n=1 Tax=Nocardia coffeae TaxID=2873381 RepID=UPI001CA667C1|nr:OsmC family protein [Nocardia coffeae]MBY8861385.1 OsmC family protein [Nocardia coffeae]